MRCTRGTRCYRSYPFPSESRNSSKACLSFFERRVCGTSCPGWRACGCCMWTCAVGCVSCAWCEGRICQGSVGSDWCGKCSWHRRVGGRCYAISGESDCKATGCALPSSLSFRHFVPSTLLLSAFLRPAQDPSHLQQSAHSEEWRYTMKSSSSAFHHSVRTPALFVHTTQYLPSSTIFIRPVQHSKIPLIPLRLTHVCQPFEPSPTRVIPL